MLDTTELALEGPMLAPLRVEVAGARYVELRQEVWSERARFRSPRRTEPGRFGYIVEVGSLRWGHETSAGRDSFAEALTTWVASVRHAASRDAAVSAAADLAALEAPAVDRLEHETFDDPSRGY